MNDFEYILHKENQNKDIIPYILLWRWSQGAMTLITRHGDVED